jgi:hypothetical protein
MERGNEGNSIATVEVIEVGEKSSLCRVVRSVSKRGVQANDLIFNQVYHIAKTRKVHFVVSGDIDLNGDGIATAYEQERLTRLIVAWGGEIDEKVNVQTDYVAMGERPASATLAAYDADVKGSVVDFRRGQQKDYDKMVKDAMRLAIPVLNVNRTRALVGI